MRLLWLAPYVPVPISGAPTRCFNTMTLLAPTCDIDLIARGDIPLRADEWLARLRAACRTVQIVPGSVSSRTHKRLVQLRALTGRRPAQYWLHYSALMQDRINQAFGARRYDAVILEHSFMGYYALPAGMPTALVQHNVESDLLRRSSRHERSALRRAYNWLEYVKYRADEQQICRSASLIMSVSECDRRAMQSWGGLPPCVVIPNGVDTAYFTPDVGAPAAQQSAGVVFTGTMNYSPNVEAMLYFVDKIWPLIHTQMPEATLSIVGHAPPREILQFGHLPNVTVTGSVPDVRPYLGAAQVVVVPLRIGSGTRLKILEALAMGRAVVSTSLGSEGLALQEGRHLLVADESAAFAARVTELLRDPARRAELGREGRRLVEETYDWRVIGLRLEAALREMAARGTPRGLSGTCWPHG
jgi:glycosyltransferase involved in cell wall biosynthesis